MSEIVESASMATDIAVAAADAAPTEPTKESNNTVDGDQRESELHYRLLSIEKLNQLLDRQPERINEVYSITANTRKLDYNVITGTPLLAAIKAGNAPVAEALIARGANLNLACEGQITPLICAIQYYKPKIACSLIRAGANLSIKDDRGRDPFYWACKRNLAEVVELLLDNGCTSSNYQGVDDFYRACQDGNDETIRVFFERGLIDVTEPSAGKGEKSPLQIACEIGHRDAALQLVAAGAPFDHENPNCAIMRAAAKYAFVEELVEAKLMMDTLILK